MRRAEAIAFFASHRDDLRSLGISSLLVFGSVARDEVRPDSDLDLIAEFDSPVGYLGLARVQHELERLRGCRVDLATPGMIRPEHRDRAFATLHPMSLLCSTASVDDLWLAVLSTRGRRRRPSVRVGMPWALSFLVWVVMARLAVDGHAFNDGWLYWLASGGLIVPVAVILASLPIGAWPSLRSAFACAVTSLVGTIAAVLMLRASREVATFALLGGLVVALLATGGYVVASSTGETARRDANDS